VLGEETGPGRPLRAKRFLFFLRFLNAKKKQKTSRQSGGLERPRLRGARTKGSAVCAAPLKAFCSGVDERPGSANATGARGGNILPIPTRAPRRTIPSQTKRVNKKKNEGIAAFLGFFFL